MERDIQERAFRLAVAVGRLGTDDDFRNAVRRTVTRQLVSAAMSVGANLEEASGAQTKADFIAKVSIARTESREAIYWMRLAGELHLVNGSALSSAQQEVVEISRIVTAIARNAQRDSSRLPRS